MSLQKAKDVIAIEAQAIRGLTKKIDRHFSKAINVLAACQGRVIVTGMGKTGIIGRKISATLSSTGTPSLFLHSAEAIHGDLGQVTKNDVVIIISNSGETDETKRLVPIIKKIKAKILYEGAGKYKIIITSDDYKKAEKILKKIENNVSGYLDEANITGRFIRE